MEGLTQTRKELIESAIKLLLDCDDYEGLNFNYESVANEKIRCINISIGSYNV